MRAQVSFSEQDPDGELLLPLKTAKKGKAKKKAVGRHPQTRAWQRRVAQVILFVSSCDHIQSLAHLTKVQYSACEEVT